MSRTIDANKLLEYIQKEKAWKQHTIQRPRYDKGKRDAYYEMLEIIQEQPTIQLESWIPVNKGMPEFDSNCIVTTENGEIFISKFYGYGEECQGFREFPEGVWQINECGLDVIAWMPLPEPYKEIENEK